MRGGARTRELWWEQHTDVTGPTSWRLEHH